MKGARDSFVIVVGAVVADGAGVFAFAGDGVADAVALHLSTDRLTWHAR